MDDKPLWETPGDIRARMDFALRTAWHHGTAAIRTHLDGTALDVPEGFRALVYREYDEARLRWGGKGLHIQVGRYDSLVAIALSFPYLCVELDIQILCSLMSPAAGGCQSVPAPLEDARSLTTRA